MACLLGFLTLTGLLRSFGALFRKKGRNSKTGYRRVKQDENVGLGSVCITHGGIFYLEHVKIIWGHSVHFSKHLTVTEKS